ncbi:phosphodiester glycosidase family protein [Streptomyces sp. NPDC002812]|uniref:phosphodiester glycosidase family protein n=1 Tax=Streptomyces sp. NPDC002812 TaxID=3154434 RepID=UPI003322EDC2
MKISRARHLRRLGAAATVLSALLIAAPANAAGEPAGQFIPAKEWTPSPTEKLSDGVLYTRYTEKEPQSGRKDPRVLNVVQINPSMGGMTLHSTVGTAAVLAETTSYQLGKVTPEQPIAGTNGGYFSPEPAHPEIGLDTIAFNGSAVENGTLLGATCHNGGEGNMAVVLQHGVPYITRIKTNLSVSVGSAKPADPASELNVRIDDINRNPGRAPGCARDAHDRATTVTEAAGAPQTVYTDANEIVLFNDSYRAYTPKPGVDPTITTDDAQGVEVVVNPNGTVKSSRTGRGGTIPGTGETILQGIGSGADWLTKNAWAAGTQLHLEQTVTDTRTEDLIPLDPSVDIVNGVHELLRNGTYVVPPLPNLHTRGQCGRLFDSAGNVKTDKTPAAAEKDDFCRDARTVIGIDTAGRTVLATITGSKAMDGAFPEEMADYLREKFSVTDAINLDGGGSTTLLTGKNRQTLPGNENSTVERPVSNAVYTSRSGYGVEAP